jgi:DNA-binding NarL/FixJ family response regulator
MTIASRIVAEIIRILVADDHLLFRKGLAGLLSEREDFQLVGTASNGQEAVAISRQVKPDVVLMDVHMPQGGGVEAVRALKKDPGPRVLMLTISDKDEDLMAAIEAGADGYLLKSVDPEQLYDSIRRVAAGQGALSPEVTGLVMRAAADSYVSGATADLSPREREVIKLLATGATTPQVAEELVISQSTVKTHIRHIYKKLDASNRAEAVAKAAALDILN